MVSAHLCTTRNLALHTWHWSKHSMYVCVKMGQGRVQGTQETFHRTPEHTHMKSVAHLNGIAEVEAPAVSRHH